MTTPKCPECEQPMVRMYSTDPDGKGRGYKSLGDRYWCWMEGQGYEVKFVKIILPPSQRIRDFKGNRS